MSTTGPLANNVKSSMFESMDKLAGDVAQYANQQNLSEVDLIKFQMAASRYNTMTTLTTNLVKELTEGEKAIAQKM